MSITQNQQVPKWVNHKQLKLKIGFNFTTLKAEHDNCNKRSKLNLKKKSLLNWTKNEQITNLGV